MNNPFTPGQGTPLTQEEVVEVEAVLDAAVAWQEGDIETFDAVKIGGLGSPGRTRCIAIRKTPKDDPRWYSLYAFCSHLDKLQGGIITRQGRFDRFEFNQAARHTEELLETGRIWKGPRT